jgi:hypothetical protein
MKKILRFRSVISVQIYSALCVLILRRKLLLRIELESLGHLLHFAAEAMPFFGQEVDGNR